MQHIVRESRMHESFCAQWGVPVTPLDVKEASATTAYGTFILDAGIRGDALSLLVALAACLIGYGEVGLWLKNECERQGSEFHLEGNPYRR
jgi:hydroxymethylpyrimidine/phosphomethylpyrimidine kinase